MFTVCSEVENTKEIFLHEILQVVILDDEMSFSSRRGRGKKRERERERKRERKREKERERERERELTTTNLFTFLFLHYDLLLGGLRTCGGSFRHFY